MFRMPSLAALVIGLTVLLTLDRTFGESNSGWEPEDTKRKWSAGARGASRTIDRVVIHCTAAIKDLKTGKITERSEWFKSKRIWDTWKKEKVYPHYYVDRAGTCYQLVAARRKALHAARYNVRSIGIELAGLSPEKWIRDAVKGKAQPEDWKYTKQQYEGLKKLLEYIKKKYPDIKAIRHSDIWDKKATVITPVLNVRKYATTVNSKIIGSLKKGERRWVAYKDGKPITNTNEKWYKLRGIENDSWEYGWVFGKLINVSYAKRKFDPGKEFDQAKVESVVKFVKSHSGE